MFGVCSELVGMKAIYMPIRVISTSTILHIIIKLYIIIVTCTTSQLVNVTVIIYNIGREVCDGTVS